MVVVVDVDQYIPSREVHDPGRMWRNVLQARLIRTFAAGVFCLCILGDLVLRKTRRFRGDRYHWKKECGVLIFQAG